MKHRIQQEQTEGTEILQHFSLSYLLFRILPVK